MCNSQRLHIHSSNPSILRREENRQKTLEVMLRPTETRGAQLTLAADSVQQELTFGELTGISVFFLRKPYTYNYWYIIYGHIDVTVFY